MDSPAGTGLGSSPAAWPGSAPTSARAAAAPRPNQPTQRKWGR